MWREREPLTDGFRSIGDLREIDLKPNELSYSLLLAVKCKSEDVCYAVYYTNHKYPDGFRNPLYKLKGPYVGENTFYIYVTLLGTNIKQETLAFTLDIPGKGKGLSIKMHHPATAYRGPGKGFGVKPQ